MLRCEKYERCVQFLCGRGTVLGVVRGVRGAASRGEVGPHQLKRLFLNRLPHAFDEHMDEHAWMGFCLVNVYDQELVKDGDAEEAAMRFSASLGQLECLEELQVG